MIAQGLISCLIKLDGKDARFDPVDITLTFVMQDDYSDSLVVLSYALIS